MTSRGDAIYDHRDLTLGSLTGLFSRYFVVGFFVPSFAALGTLALLLTHGTQPNPFVSLGFRPKLIVVAILAVFVGGVLLALRFFIRELFIGALPQAVLRVWPLGPTYGYLLRRQRRRFETALEERSEEEDARDVAVLLDRRFPYNGVRLRPTRFGNVVRGYESYPWVRFGLDDSVVWKRVDTLLTTREQELQATARSDVEVLLNGSLLAAIVGMTVFLDRLVHPSATAASVLGFAAISYFLYRLAASAEERFGNEKRASIDLHRLELYERLGFRAPRSFLEERDRFAPVLNDLLLWGTEVEDELYAGAYPERR